MKKQFLLLASFLVTASVVFSQQSVVAPPESLVVEGVPAILTGVAETAGRYGAYRKMHEFLERIAPMNNIEKIKKPMLVIAGKNDPRVPVSESDQIARALKRQGTPVWYIMAKDEGHGFQKKANQDYQFYAVVEFLREFHLK
jgi:dipeptidyl aminopeptidase/acylaminoacyl peptidase